MSKESQARKNNFSDTQLELYIYVSGVLNACHLNTDIWEPEIEEVLDVLHEEWLDESTALLEEIEEQDEFDEEFQGMIEEMG